MTSETDPIGIFAITPQKIRNLSGKPTVNEVSTDDIANYLTLGTGIIIGETKKSDWSIKDAISYTSLQGALTLYAKSFVLEQYDDKDPMSIKTLRDEFWRLIKSIKGGVVQDNVATEEAVFYNC